MEQVILLVDDEPDLLHALSRALHREPYRIYTARTAEESIAILKAHPVDLIVSDENMPGMRGTKFLAWVAEHFPDVPRIMLTGQDAEQVRTRAEQQSKVFRFFTKPCSVTELAEAIREGLQLRAEQREALSC